MSQQIQDIIEREHQAADRMIYRARAQSRNVHPGRSAALPGKRLPLAPP